MLKVKGGRVVVVFSRNLESAPDPLGLFGALNWVVVGPRGFED